MTPDEEAEFMAEARLSQLQKGILRAIWDETLHLETALEARGEHDLLRRVEVLQLWHRWGDKPGLQTLIAAHLGVSKSTICRDLQKIFPLMTDCPTCGQLRPRYWFAEE